MQLAQLRRVRQQSHPLLVRDYTCNTRRQGRIVDIIAPVTGLETDDVTRSTSVTGVD